MAKLGILQQSDFNKAAEKSGASTGGGGSGGTQTTVTTSPAPGGTGGPSHRGGTARHRSRYRPSRAK